MVNKKFVWIVCAGLLMAAALGCGTVSVPVLSVGALQEEQQVLPIEDVTSGDIQLLMGTGELKVSPGADGLLEGVFRYNVKEWKPEIERNNVGSMASVLIRQGHERDNLRLAGKGARNEWDIRLATQLPMRLAVSIGAGSSELDLSGVSLSRLSVEGGAGDATIRFNTPNPEKLDEIEANCGAGTIEMQSAGNANFERLTLRGGAGEVMLDLSGNWTRSASVEVTTGVGQVTIQTPTNVGVKVKTGTSPVGKVVIEGLTPSDGGYINAAYATADIKVDISVTTGIGEVRVVAR